MIDHNLLLFIEPKQKRSKEPIIDNITKKMTASLRKSKVINTSFGKHKEICGCISSCAERELRNGERTNTLAIHYCAFHRNEISKEQIKRIENLHDGEEEPTVQELWPHPDFKKIDPKNITIANESLGITFLDYPDCESHAIIVYFPGCHHNCKGCHSPKLKDHNYKNSTTYTIDYFIKILKQILI